MNTDFSKVQNSETQVWFNSLIGDIRYDQLLFETEIIDPEKKKVYEGLMNKDYDPMFEQIRQTSSLFYVDKVVKLYFKELFSKKTKPKRIALELSDSKVLVWAEIAEDDEATEDALILSEAKVNAEFSKYGFYISSTIVEDCDNLEIPKHYKELNLKA